MHTKSHETWRKVFPIPSCCRGHMGYAQDLVSRSIYRHLKFTPTHPTCPSHIRIHPSAPSHRPGGHQGHVRRQWPVHKRRTGRCIPPVSQCMHAVLHFFKARWGCMYLDTDDRTGLYVGRDQGAAPLLALIALLPLATLLALLALVVLLVLQHWKHLQDC